MKVIQVEGANGTLHTNYVGKEKAAVRALLQDGYDFAYVHVEAPDEMGHQGSIERKIQAIEFLDEKVIKVIKEDMEQAKADYRMLVLPDHPTPIACRTHTSDPVPYMLYDSGKERKYSYQYNEAEAKKSGNVVKHGYEIINKLFES